MLEIDLEGNTSDWGYFVDPSDPKRRNIYKQPKPKVTSSVVRFQLNEDKLNLKKANIFINLIFKNIRKKIYKNLKLDNKHDNLYNKRVNEISIKDLLNIYNSFQP